MDEEVEEAEEEEAAAEDEKSAVGVVAGTEVGDKGQAEQRWRQQR